MRGKVFMIMAEVPGRPVVILKADPGDATNGRSPVRAAHAACAAAMPKFRLHNDNEKILGVWVEPLGEDFWTKPKEQFTISTATAQGVDPHEAPFDVVFHDQGVSVHVNIGDEAVVRDQSGTEAACGHQQPLEVLRAWTEAAEAAAQRTAESSSTLREMTREHAESVRRGTHTSRSHQAGTRTSTVTMTTQVTGRTAS
ncbi:hypothetical protein [Streptomyces sp. NPDC058086]|uniref:hypothetical protein n=1 Tax=Streptomyces sp. NPDC058086 TaxID=3346334 RepID=UPI0036EB2FD1